MIIKICKVFIVIVNIIKFKIKVRDEIRKNKFNFLLVISVIIIVIGAVIISTIEGISLEDALWWSFVTFTTVGYGDVLLKTQLGRIFAVILMIIGIGVIGVITTTITLYIVNSGRHNSADNYKNHIIEDIKEKLDNYEELSDEDIYSGLIKGCSDGEIAPVLCGSATKVIGIQSMLENIIGCFPSPKYSLSHKAIDIDTGDEISMKIEEDKPFSAYVFKTIADPFVGKISLFKVITGKLNGDTVVKNTSSGKQEKLSHLFFMRGKNQIATDEIIAGDIGAVAKLQFTSTGDTLCSQELNIKYNKINLPVPVMPMAILPKAKGDEEKISLALSKLNEEDPVFKIERDKENAETIIWGLGETHLEVIASRIKNKFGAEVILQTPKVPYRETIKGKADVQGKHKKQSGGHGQYGDVKIKFEPRNDGQRHLV